MRPHHWCAPACSHGGGAIPNGPCAPSTMSASGSGSMSPKRCRPCAGSISPRPPTPTCCALPCLMRTAGSGRMRPHGAPRHSMRGCRRLRSQDSSPLLEVNDMVGPSRAGSSRANRHIRSSRHGCSERTATGPRVRHSTTTTGCTISSVRVLPNHRNSLLHGPGCRVDRLVHGMRSRDD